MPHAITISRITTLESRGEQSQWLCACRSRWRWDGLDFDGVIGGNQVYSRLKAHSMIGIHWEKNAPGNNTLLCCAYSSNAGCKAQ